MGINFLEFWKKVHNKFCVIGFCAEKSLISRFWSCKLTDTQKIKIILKPIKIILEGLKYKF